MIKNGVLFLLLIISSLSVSGQTGGVRGMVLDIETLKPLGGATINVVGTSFQSVSDESGEFFISLPADPAREYRLDVSMVGYVTDSVKVVVAGDQPAMVNVTLVAENSVLEEVVVIRRRERVSEAMVLDMRRKSNAIVEMVGAQELSRKGVGDVESALINMSGISRMAGSNQVYVRGLGDRYNSTTLNGLPIPSNDPERKNIDLNLFSTDIVDYVAVDKVYGAHLSGDYAGGNIDIQSKLYSGKAFFELTLGGTTNTNTIAQWDNFRLQHGPGRLGFVRYQVPQDPLNGWNFANSLNPVFRKPVAGTIGLTAGQSFEFANGSRLSLFGTARFDNEYQYREGVNRELASGGEQLKDFDVLQYGYVTHATGMLNVAYQRRSGHRFYYNMLFVNSSDQYRASYRGFIRDMAENATAIWQRSMFRQNRLIINQLIGEHSVTDWLELDWGISANRVRSEMPDRIQNITRIDDNLGYRVLARNNPSDNHRYYQQLTEDDYAFSITANYHVGPSTDRKGTFTLGYNGKLKRREFEDIQYNFNINQLGMRQEVDPENLDAFFNEHNRVKSGSDGGYFTIQGFVGDFPQVYTGDQNIHAVYGTFDYRLTERLLGVFGMRYEHIRQSIFYLTNLDRSGTTSTFTRNGFLPTVNLKYQLTDNQNLRLGLSRTYTLPQFKERALFIYEKDATERIQGNPQLYPSQDYNIDVKWEMFPKITELLAVTVFGKYIVDPISQITLASSTNDVSFINTGDWGTVLGTEIEIKKDLLVFADGACVFSVGGNAAYMWTNQEIDPEKVRQETRYNLNTTHERATFTGASPFIANADLSFSSRWAGQRSLISTLVYNYYSDRIYALGTQGKGNQIDKGVSSLDLIIKYGVNRRLGVDIAARNLLNPTFERIQDNAKAPVTIVSYKTGVRFSFGIRYSL